MANLISSTSRRMVPLIALMLVLASGAAVLAAPAQARNRGCRDPLTYGPRGGGWALIIGDLKVHHVTCRRAARIGGAYTARDPMPAGWHCEVSEADYRTYCRYRVTRRRFDFNFEGDAS